LGAGSRRFKSYRPDQPSLGSFGSARQLFIMKFYYVYILLSKKNPNRFYTGFTENLESRLRSHNSGDNPHTSKYKLWRIKTTVAFTDRHRALDFEAYLKSPSGRAFAKKRL
jgi:putative endonuclease